MFEDLPVLLIQTTKILPQELFDTYADNIKQFGINSGYSIFIYNGPIDERILKLWSDLKLSIEVDDQMVKNIKEKRVMVLQLKGMSDEDQEKVMNIINESVSEKYDIQTLVIDDRTKLVSLKQFFNQVEKDVGLINDKRLAKIKQGAVRKSTRKKQSAVKKSTRKKKDE